MPIPPRRFVFGSSTTALLFYCLGTTILLGSILLKTQFHFTYTLDDAYIHLALSERIGHGFYGLNAGETVSPSSSVLWPFVFAPFTGTTVMTYIPLVINLLFGALTAWLLGDFVDAWLPYGGKTSQSARRVLLVCLMILGCNLLALPFTGMEHSLQILLSVCCALGVVRALRGDEMPAWCIVAAMLLPSVRYEGILCTATLTIALWVSRKRGLALLLVPASLVAPICLSLYLHAKGLPWMPLSVIQKSGVQGGGSMLHEALSRAGSALWAAARDLERLPETGLMLALIFLLWRNRKRTSIALITGAATCACALQVLYGPFGWFYRYEPYMVAFSLIVVLAVDSITTLEATESNQSFAHGVPSEIPGYLLTSVAALAISYIAAVAFAPIASMAIYRQQGQMAKFTHNFYTGPVAVNDLGLVAYHHDPNEYVLDLEGLGSYEALQARKSGQLGWIDALTRKHNIGLAIIYPEWYVGGIPKDWVPIAKMCKVDTHFPAYPRVMFYATPTGDAVVLRQQLTAFKMTVPFGVMIELDPQDTSLVCKA